MKKFYFTFWGLLIGIVPAFCAGIGEAMVMVAIYSRVNQVRNQQILTLIIGLVVTGIVALAARKYAGRVLIAGLIIIAVICLLLQMQLSGLTY